jgi:PAS domain S-box-containing protein
MTAAPTAPPTEPARPPDAPSPGAAVALFLGFAALTVALGIVSYRSAATDLLADRRMEFEAVADSKADLVRRWRAERLADAETLAADPLLAEALLSGRAGERAEAAAELRSWFDGLRATGDYLFVTVTDESGAIRIAAGVLPAADHDHLRALARRAVATRAPFVGDLRTASGGVALDIVAPLYGRRGEPAGAVIIRSDAQPYLLRAVEAWPRSSPSGEGLLVQRAGPDVVVLNAPRHGGHGPLTLRRPADDHALPAARAIRGERGAGVGIDYRGVEVLAATTGVAGSPWGVVVKEDLVDVLAPLRERGAWTFASVLALVAVAAGGLLALWRKQVHQAERMRLEAELARTAFARKIERLTRYAHDMVFVADGDQRIVEVNDRATALLGFSRAELLGMHVRDLRDPATLEDYEGRVKEQVQAGGARFETIYRCKDGTAMPVEVSVHTEEFEGRRYFHGIVRDVADRKRLEAQLALAARLASVGTLAGGVAHEINNPLSLVVSNVDFALGELARAGVEPEVVRALEDARDGGRRVRDIVRGLQAFARRGGHRETLDLREVMDAAVNMIGNELRHRARLVVERGPVPPVRANANGLGQAFVNLLANAAQAIPEGHAVSHTIRIATSTAPDGRAVVSVSDTGVGIPPEIVPRIFDPFFTTRPVGEGSGLGLSMCHGIVAAAGGEITVESAPGEGSTFRVLLPPTGATGETPPPGPPLRPAQGGARARILVVDDEPLVGMAVVRLLSGAHDVEPRTSAREALELLSGGARFDLILCDLMMPDMSGIDLHAALRESQPEQAARMVFLTGGAFTPAAQEFLDRLHAEPVPKPFERATLVERIERELAARRAGPQRA